MKKKNVVINKDIFCIQKMDCVFCDLKQKNNKNNLNKFLYTNRHFYIIKDINPKYTKHFLVISKFHFPHLNLNQWKYFKKLEKSHKKESRLKLNLFFSNFIKQLPKILKTLKLNNGFKIIINSIYDQEINHLHLHLVYNK